MNERFFLTLVRHGETAENRESIIQGQADTSLSELGRKQAAMAGKRLQYERFTHMFSSDLSRAADTAQAIADANQVTVCKVVKDPRLRERSFGVMQGKTFSDLQNMLREKNIPMRTYTPEEGESIEQVGKRAVSFFNEVCSIVTSHVKESQATAGNQPKGQSSQTLGLGQCTRGTSRREEEDDSKNGNQSTGANNLNFSSQDIPNALKPLSIEVKNSPSPNVLVRQQEFANAGCTGDQNIINILIVSHGLLLKELKKIILNLYIGKLPDDVTFIANRVSPNTGVSKFAMCVSKQGAGKMSVRCIESCFLDCKSHLRSLDSDVDLNVAF